MVTILPVFQTTLRIAVAHRRHFADRLGKNVANAFEHLLDGVDPLFGVDEFFCGGVQVGERLVAGPDPKRQRLETACRERRKPWCVFLGLNGR